MNEFRLGWKVVVASLIGVALSSTNILIYTIGMFMPQLHREFGWGFREIQLALLISTGIQLFTIPMVSEIADRYGPRRVAIVSATALSAAIMMHAFITHSIWSYYLLTALLAAGGVGTLSLTWTKLITLWFQQSRGMALGLALLGTGLGGALLKPITATLIAHYGWRGAYVGIGLLTLVVVVPLTLIWFRPPPVDIGAAAVSGGSETGMRYGEAARDWRFWALGLCFMPVGVAIGAVIANMETILSQQGMRHDQIVVVVTFIGLAVMLGRISGGYLLDRINAALIGAVLIALIALACLLVTVTPVTFVVASIAVILVGLGSGVEYDVMAFMTARLFGMRAYSRVYGNMLMFYFVGGALGPVIFGAVFDARHSYNPALIGAALALIPSVVLILLVGLIPRARRFGVPDEVVAAA